MTASENTAGKSKKPNITPKPNGQYIHTTNDMANDTASLSTENDTIFNAQSLPFNSFTHITAKTTVPTANVGEPR